MAARKSSLLEKCSDQKRGVWQHDFFLGAGICVSVTAHRAEPQSSAVPAPELERCVSPLLLGLHEKVHAGGESLLPAGWRRWARQQQAPLGDQDLAAGETEIHGSGSFWTRVERGWWQWRRAEREAMVKTAGPLLIHGSHAVVRRTGGIDA